MLRQFSSSVTAARGGPSGTFFGAAAAGAVIRISPTIAAVAADPNLTMQTPPSEKLDGTLGIGGIGGQERGRDASVAETLQRVDNSTEEPLVTLRCFSAFSYSSRQFGSVPLLYMHGRIPVRPMRGRLYEARFSSAAARHDPIGRRQHACHAGVRARCAGRRHRRPASAGP